MRESPGVLGGSVFLLLPLLYFVPLETMSFFGDRLRGIAALSWLFALSLALALRGSRSLRDETLIWPVQKGLSAGDLVLEDWILDLGILGAFGAWWGTMALLALGNPGGPVALTGLALFSLSLSTGLLTHSLTLFLSAVGAKRPTDPTALLAIVSILIPVLTFHSEGWVADMAEWVFPPFHAAIRLSASIRGMSWPGVIEALFQIVLYSGLLLLLGIWRMSRWRPKG
jgi:hypothetical protein